MKLLLIDDNADNLLSLAAMLRSYLPGCAMDTATSGPVGITRAMTWQPDVILLDIQMPEMDGFQVCQALKRDKATCHIPVIFLTAVSTESTSRIRGLEIGGDAFVTKPFDPGELIAQVHAMLRIKQAEDALRSEVHDLFEASRDGIVYTDLDGRYQNANQAFIALLGYASLEELRALSDAEITPPGIQHAAWQAYRHQTLTHGYSEEYEKVLCRKTGEHLWVSVRESLRYNAAGRPIGIWSIVRDITERILAVEALNKSEQRFRALVDNIPGVVYRCQITPPWAVDYISPAIEALCGHGAQEFIDGRMHYADIIWPDDAHDMARSLAKAVASRRAYELEYRILHAFDGTVRWVLERGEAYYSDEGVPVFLEGVIVDLTARKLVEQQLLDSEQKFRLLAENISDMITFHGRDGRYRYVSPSCRDILGYAPDELLGADPYPLFHPDDVPRIQQAHEAVVVGRLSTIQYRMRGKDGQYRWLETNNTRIGDTDDAPILICATRDITERKRMEQALQLSEASFRLLAENARDAIFRYCVGPTPCFEYISPSVYAITGFTPEELYGDSAIVLSLVHPDDQPLFAGTTWMDAGAHDGFVFRLRHKDGGIRWIEVLVSQGRNEEGQLVAIEGIARDITRRKIADDRQKLTADLLRQLNSSDTMADIIRQILLLVKSYGGVEAAAIRLTKGDDFPYYVTDGFTEQFVQAESTICRADACGVNTLECVCGAVLMGRGDATRPYFTSGGSFWTNTLCKLLETSGGLDQLIPAIRGRCPREGYASMALIPLRSDAEIIGLLQLNDRREGALSQDLVEFFESIGAIIGIALRRKMEQDEREQYELQLRQAQKLEAIGQLAAGIAHEINTPVQFVGDNLQFLQTAFAGLMANTVPAGTASESDSADQDADVAYFAQEIPAALEDATNGVQRIAKIVRAMKEFSHPNQGEMTAINLNHAIESTITVARNEWKYVADIETKFDEALPPVSCFPGDINQVILNIVVNAAHAIAAAEGPTQAKGLITISTARKGNDAVIKISDTGTGIPEAIRLKVFDPFFTTKDVGVGTGQGLAISYSIIVNKHKGKIYFDTVVGQGTTFVIELPMPGQAQESAMAMA